MNIIVFGANGGVGKHFTKLALDKGHEVTAFVRSPSKLELVHELLTIIQGELLIKRPLKKLLQVRKLLFLV